MQQRVICNLFLYFEFFFVSFKKNRERESLKKKNRKFERMQDDMIAIVKSLLAWMVERPVEYSRVYANSSLLSIKEIIQRQDLERLGFQERKYRRVRVHFRRCRLQILETGLKTRVRVNTRPFIVFAIVAIVTVTREGTATRIRRRVQDCWCRHSRSVTCMQAGHRFIFRHDPAVVWALHFWIRWSNIRSQHEYRVTVACVSPMSVTLYTSKKGETFCVNWWCICFIYILVSFVKKKKPY